MRGSQIHCNVCGIIGSPCKHKIAEDPVFWKVKNEKWHDTNDRIQGGRFGRGPDRWDPSFWCGVCGNLTSPCEHKIAEMSPEGRAYYARATTQKEYCEYCNTPLSKEYCKHDKKG